MISVNYPHPVTVNGYACKNCTDVDNAKHNIDPSHPKDGPFGVNAKDHAASAHKPRASQDTTAVTFSGLLNNVSKAANANTVPSATQGLRLDVSV